MLVKSSFIMCISPIEIERNSQVYHVPCGRCIDCVNHRASDWRQRCLLECKTTDIVFFSTMTIDDEHMPKTLGLVHPSKRMIQLFHKRLRIFITRRKLNLTFKYFLASEYGPQKKNQYKVKSKFKRPHYHALYFVNGEDAKDFPYIFEKIWNFGFCFVDQCRSKERSSSYIVKYVSSIGTNPYFGNNLKFDDYVSFSERSSSSASFDARTFNTFCLHSTTIGKKYFQKVLVPRFKKNLAEVIEFLRSQSVNIVRIIKHFFPYYQTHHRQSASHSNGGQLRQSEITLRAWCYRRSQQPQRDIAPLLRHTLGQRLNTCRPTTCP